MTTQDPTAKPVEFIGYGDESITPQAIVYSVAIFSVQKQIEAEAALSASKRLVGLTDEDRIHCKSMFGHHARQKTCWGKVSPEKISWMIEQLCAKLASLQERPISFIMPNTRISIDPLESGGKPTLLDAKGIASLGCSMIQPILVERYGYGATILWTDPDRTKIPWWGGQTRQAQNTRGVFVDLGSHIEPPRITPQIGQPKIHRLLEIADLYAYISAQSVSSQGGVRHRWWFDRLRTINPERLLFDPAPGTRVT
ncbi:MAG TPA: hypothetical protein PK866_09680 [Nitrospira sp.]|nr:hypothetical protein [Nitrospira sp.]